MKLRGGVVLIVVCAAVAVAGGLYWRVATQCAPPSGDVDFGASRSRGETVWPHGERRTFATRMVSRVRMEEQSLFDVSLRGLLTATRVDVDSLKIVTELRIEELTLTGSPDEQARLSEALVERFVMEFTPTGTLKTVGFAELRKAHPSAAAARGLLRTLAAAFQVVRPPNPDVVKWDAEEPDIVGAVRTHYVRNGSALVKTKSEYLRVSAVSPILDARPELVASEAKLTLGSEEPSPESLAGLSLIETSRVRSEGPLPTLSSSIELDLRLVEQAAESASTLSQIEASIGGHRMMELSDRTEESQATVDHAKVQGPTFAELLASVQRLDPGNARERARLFSLLKTQLRFDEKNVEEAERLIATGAMQKSALIDALGAAGSARAQEVLGKIVRGSRYSDADRHRALISLSFVERASPETIGVLKDMQGDPDYRTQALYGLGTAAYNLRTSDPELARELGSELANKLDDTDAPNEQVVMLKAVGNAGNAETLDSIEQKLKHPDPAVRATAVWALRRIPGDRADQGIALLLRRDPVPAVRLRALESIAYRSPVPVLVYALREGLQQEQDVVVRREIVRAALRWANAAPVLGSALAVLAHSDPDEKVRELLSGWTR